MSEHPSSGMRVILLGFEAAWIDRIKISLFSSTSNNVCFSFFSYTVKAHSCSTLDQMKPYSELISLVFLSVSENLADAN